MNIVRAAMEDITEDAVRAAYRLHTGLHRPGRDRSAGLYTELY